MRSCIVALAPHAIQCKTSVPLGGNISYIKFRAIEILNIRPRTIVFHSLPFENWWWMSLCRASNDSSSSIIRKWWRQSNIPNGIWNRGLLKDRNTNANLCSATVSICTIIRLLGNICHIDDSYRCKILCWTDVWTLRYVPACRWNNHVALCITAKISMAEDERSQTEFVARKRTQAIDKYSHNN